MVLVLIAFHFFALADAEIELCLSLYMTFVGNLVISAISFSLKCIFFPNVIEQAHGLRVGFDFFELCFL